MNKSCSLGEVVRVEAIIGGPDSRVSGSPHTLGGVASIGDGVTGGAGVVDHGEHEALGAEVEVQGFLRPGRGILWNADDSGGLSGRESTKTGEAIGDVAIHLFHIDHNEVAPSMTSDLPLGRQEARQ